jgi:hypothetical protein
LLIKFGVVVNNLIGYSWLCEKFNFTLNHFHSSKIGNRLKTEVASDGRVTVHYTPQYYPGDAPLDHVAFALKHEGLNLDLLRKVFSVIPRTDIVPYFNSTPSGKYTRQIGFLYEFVTGAQLDGVVPAIGNYVDVADPELYVLPQGVKDSRWRVNNNLPGGRNFCPLVRKTESIAKYLDVNFSEMIDETVSDVPPDIFRRAINYFYFKETKSSNDIEHEAPSRQREELFVDLLRTAGSVELADRLSEKSLAECQNVITDPRFNDDGYRLTQNYVGESVAYGRRSIIHLVGLPPEYLQDAMHGMAEFAKRSTGMNSIIRATCLSFGFVFIHPFEDGNGRIHRFLLNDVMSCDGVLKKGIILPVSAIMLKSPHEYDDALERFSKPLMKAVEYNMDDDERITVINSSEIAGFYQYPDMTIQAEYMFKVVEDTIKHELVSELQLIQAFDRFSSDIKDIVDLPNRELDLIMKLVHQGHGILTKTKRDKFPMLSDDEIEKIEGAYTEAFTVSIPSSRPK